MDRDSKGLSLDRMAFCYDRITFAEKSAFRRKQIDLMALQPGERVLDVGCGTGALSVPAKRAVEESGRVCGVDIAPKMIARAREKAKRYRLEIGLHLASIDEMPFRDGSFDVVMSSLMFHHLPVPIKERGLGEVHRVLRQDGRFYLMDFCSPHVLAVPLMAPLLAWRSSTRHQLLGKLPGLIGRCGFGSVVLAKKGLFLEYYAIRKAPGPGTGGGRHSE